MINPPGRKDAEHTPMKLLTKADAAKLPAIYSQQENPDPVVVIKFFCPWNQWTWYAYEGGPAYDLTGNDDYEFFGLVRGFDTEKGYFTLSELSRIRGPFGLRIERDMSFVPAPLSEVRRNERV